MSENTAKGLSKIPNDTYYYYFCPDHISSDYKSGEMEQGVDDKHECLKTSINQYNISYDTNFPSDAAYTVGKTSPESGYFYNVFTEGASVTYEDKTMVAKNYLKGYTASGTLNLSNIPYTAAGYVFDGWWTEKNRWHSGKVMERPMFSNRCKLLRKRWNKNAMASKPRRF
jgi:hypothetical protein